MHLVLFVVRPFFKQALQIYKKSACSESSLPVPDPIEVAFAVAKLKRLSAETAAYLLSSATNKD